MHTIQDKWEEILQHLKTEYEITQISFDTWIKPLKIHSVQEDKVFIIVPSQKVGLDYVSRKYLLPLKVSIAEVCGTEYEICLILPEEMPSSEPEEAEDIIEGLNPKYTFDTFVVGSNNRFAHAASLAVAESPGEVYNPLFLYGGVGLGKTHLMHSIAHFIHKNNPSLKILYVTSEQFTNEVIEAIRNSSNTAISKFREKYRNIDVLLIDDVQFIIGKESTQEEFFHTFNALHTAHKQIILSSDRPPKDMDILEERIRSRFEWGLMADIQSPNFETRMAILRKKQAMDGYDVGDEVISYIAEHIDSNIRELEGSLNKVIAMAHLEKKEINLDLAEKALRDIVSPNQKKEITVDYIIDLVADHFDISPKDIKGEKKERRLAYPRQIAMYLCREFTNMNLNNIGKIMGNRDHSTVLYGTNKIEKDISVNENTRNIVELLKKKINPST